MTMPVSRDTSKEHKEVIIKNKKAKKKINLKPLIPPSSSGQNTEPLSRAETRYGFQSQMSMNNEN